MKNRLSVVAAALSGIFQFGDIFAPQIERQQGRKRKTGGKAVGTAFTKGKRHKSLKERSNRRKR